jgi:hypothetical protein
MSPYYWERQNRQKPALVVTTAHATPTANNTSNIRTMTTQQTPTTEAVASTSTSTTVSTALPSILNASAPSFVANIILPTQQRNIEVSSDAQDLPTRTLNQKNKKKAANVLSPDHHDLELEYAKIEIRTAQARI